MTDSHAPWSHPTRLADPGKRRVSGFDLAPGPDARAAIAAALDITAVKKLRLTGTLTPVGQRDWELTARLGATVVQPCVISLAPVTTRIDETVTRRYLADLTDPADLPGEVEMPEDDTAEPLPATLDLGDVMVEALTLALPDFPRAPGVKLAESVFTAPGRAAMRDQDARPFAGLAALRDTMKPRDET